MVWDQRRRQRIPQCPRSGRSWPPEGVSGPSTGGLEVGRRRSTATPRRCAWQPVPTGGFRPVDVHTGESDLGISRSVRRVTGAPRGPDPARHRALRPPTQSLVGCTSPGPRLSTRRWHPPAPRRVARFPDLDPRRREHPLRPTRDPQQPGRSPHTPAAPDGPPPVAHPAAPVPRCPASAAPADAADTLHLDAPQP